MEIWHEWHSRHMLAAERGWTFQGTSNTNARNSRRLCICSIYTQYESGVFAIFRGYTAYAYILFSGVTIGMLLASRKYLLSNYIITVTTIGFHTSVFKINMKSWNLLRTHSMTVQSDVRILLWSWSRPLVGCRDTAPPTGTQGVQWCIPCYSALRHSDASPSDKLLFIVMA